MIRLNVATLGAAGRDAAVRVAVAVPGYDRGGLRRRVAHLGVGAFHRCHQAEYFDDLAHLGGDWGIVGVNIATPDVCADLATQDGLYLRILRHSDADHDDRRVIGSMVGFVPVARVDRSLPRTDSTGDDDRRRTGRPTSPTQPARKGGPWAAVSALADPAVAMISTTITEKGYCHVPASRTPDETHADLAHDLHRPQEQAPRTAPGVIAAGLELRAAEGAPAVTLVSCDNVASNGVVLETMVRHVLLARRPDLAGWLDDQVGFVSTMVDRIVPATDPGESDALAEVTGVIDRVPVVGEPFRQWVLQDAFRGDRPPLERVGVEVVADVEPYEVIKFRLVNGAQSMLSHLGALAGLATTADAVAHPVLRALVERQLAVEVKPGLPKVAVDLDEYRAEVVRRVLNRALHHTCHQICTDGSQKIVPRFVVPMREALDEGRTTPILALGIAAWARTQLGVADTGERFRVSDPESDAVVARIKAAGSDPLSVARAIVARPAVFGDLGDRPVAVDLIARGWRALADHGAIGAAAEYLALRKAEVG